MLVMTGFHRAVRRCFLVLNAGNGKETESFDVKEKEL